jgi:tRNA A-37 threonylcarbamoyl transferase component Bud32
MVTDRDLLLAIHALRTGWIDGDQLSGLTAEWSADKTRPIAERLLELGWVDQEELLRLGRLVDADLGPLRDEPRVSPAVLTDEESRAPTITDPCERGADFATYCGTGPAPGETVVLDTSADDRARDVARDGSRGPCARYARSHLHARGGVGQVWLVIDSVLGREVALKELRPEQEANRSAWDRFCDEAQIVGQLEHPCIVPVYEFATDLSTRRPFYTMRFIRGGTLTDAIRAYHKRRIAGQAGPSDLASLLNAFVSACDAIGYAHSQGVIHRDIKGQNIVLGEMGEVMVLDWGLAKRVGQPEHSAGPEPVSADWAHDATLQGQIMGTPSYMAPEQAEGRIEAIDRRTDVYGLGAILYEILSDRPPHQGGSTDELLRHVREVVPTPPRSFVPDAPPALEAICLEAMARLPEARYASARELAEDVRRWLADEPVFARHDPWPARPCPLAGKAPDRQGLAELPASPLGL